MTDNECPIHRTDNGTCGGPHDEVFTHLGWEVGKLGFTPVGVPITPTENDEQNRYSLKSPYYKGF